MSGKKWRLGGTRRDLPPPKKRDVSLAIFSISGRYPLHAEGVSAIRAQMLKRLHSYVHVRHQYGS